MTVAMVATGRDRSEYYAECHREARTNFHKYNKNPSINVASYLENVFFVHG